MVEYFTIPQMTKGGSMNEPVRKYMKVGLIHFMAYPEVIKGEGPILETLEEIAKDDYFDVVEVTWIKDSGIREKAKEMLEVSGLEVKYGAQPRLLIPKLDINSLNEEEREKAIETVKEGIDEAIEIGATGLALLSGKDPGINKRNKAKEALIDSLKQICKYADLKEEGFPIALEIFDRDIDKRCLIGPVEEAKEVAIKVKEECDNFGLLHDLSHLPLLKETPEEALYPIKDYLTHIHIGNCVLKDKNHEAYGDQHPRFGIKGGENGVDEVVLFLKVLFDMGYLNEKERKVVSFEVKPLKDESSDIVITNAKRTLNKAWSKLEVKG